MTLPEWLDPLYAPDEMRAADRFAMDQRGIFELELAEKAGAGLASAVEAVAEPGPIRIVVGPGTNGGDGLIAARLLRKAGYVVDVLAPLPLDGLEGVPRTNLDRLPGPAPQTFDVALLRDSGAIVDALLGTGFEGAVGELLDEVIAAINAQGAPVVAADVPSGVNVATGEVEGPAVEATVTSTNPCPEDRAVRGVRSQARGLGANGGHRHPARRPWCQPRRAYEPTSHADDPGQIPSWLEA